MGVAEYVNQDAVNEMTDVYDGRLIFTLLCCFWKVGPLAAEDVVLHLVDSGGLNVCLFFYMLLKSVLYRSQTQAYGL